MDLETGLVNIEGTCSQHSRKCSIGRLSKHPMQSTWAKHEQWQSGRDPWLLAEVFTHGTAMCLSIVQQILVAGTACSSGPYGGLGRLRPWGVYPRVAPADRNVEGGIEQSVTQCNYFKQRLWSGVFASCSSRRPVSRPPVKPALRNSQGARCCPGLGTSHFDLVSARCRSSRRCRQKPC